MTLRIAFVAGTLRVGGAEKQLAYMAEALARAGVEIQVFSLGTPDEPFARRLREGGIPVWTMARSRSRIVRLARLVSAVRRFAPDLIQATHFFAGFYAITAGLATGRPVIGAVRNNLSAELRANGALSRWLYRMPSLLIANSHAALAYAPQADLDPARLRLIPNAISLDGWRYRDTDCSGAPGRGVVAIAVANLHHAKRLDRFIDALVIARRSSPALRGVIVGSGILDRELKETARARGLDETALRFVGHSDDVNGLLARADFLCLSSSAEGTPNAVLEAMATGLPVVATAVGDVPFLVQDGVTGYVVPEDDAHAMAARMVALSASPPLREAMGRAGRARAERDYSTGDLARRLCAVYHEAADRPRYARVLRKVDHLARRLEMKAL